jgi:hypothetical protein
MTRAGVIAMSPKAKQQVDALSGWATAPAAARLAGDEAYRFFDTPTAAFTFLAENGGAALKQARYRARQRRGIAVLTVPVAPEVVEAMIDAGQLDAECSADRAQVAAAASELLRRWAREWHQQNSRYR